MSLLKQVLVALFFISIMSASAQQADDSTSIKVITLEDVVISVNKTEEQKKTVAQKVQVLKASEIAATQSQTTADVLSSTGNVFIQKSQQGGGSVGIRGFEANRVLMMIDGVRMNNIIYRGGHLQNVITVDNAALDRIEVLFGPSSTIYGSDALGGVVNFFTRNPDFASEDGMQNKRLNAMARYGSINDEFTSHADFNIGGTNLASFTSITYSMFDDLKGGENQNPFYTSSYGERPYYVERIDGKDSLVKNPDRFVQVASGYSQYDILQKLSFKQNSRVMHGLNLQFSNSTDIPRYDRLTDPNSSGTGYRYAEWYYGPQTRLLTAYDLNIHNTESYFQHIHADINYQMLEESRHNRSFGSPNLSHRKENVNVIGANLDVLKVVGKNDLRAGVDFQYNTLKSTAKR